MSIGEQFSTKFAEVHQMMCSPGFDFIEYANGHSDDPFDMLIRSKVKKYIDLGFKHNSIRDHYLLMSQVNPSTGSDEYKSFLTKSALKNYQRNSSRGFCDCTTKRGLAIKNRLRKKLADRKRQAELKAIEDEMCKQL